jgi:hypothetical protein
LIDFGDDSDTFVNNYGAFDFTFALLGLDGFNHNFDLPSDTLSSVQVSNPGPIVIDNNGANGEIRFINGGTNIIAPVTHFNLQMLDGSGTDVNLRLDNAFAGDLFIDLGDGARTLNLDGVGNSIGGDLEIVGGTGNQTVNFAVNSGLFVSGVASIGLGSGTDTIADGGNNSQIDGDLELIGTNNVDIDGFLAVSGNLMVDNSTETTAAVFSVDGGLSVTGNFTYLGGLGRDEVRLGGPLTTDIFGNALIELGDNAVGGTQLVSLSDPLTRVRQNLTINSINTFSQDTVDMDPGTVVGSAGGNLEIGLGGGVNTALIQGAGISGSSVKYNGGSGTDLVTLADLGALPSDVNIKLAGGADTFTLDSVATPFSSLRVDFGGGDDAFVNNVGSFGFNAKLLNWHGYSRFYELATDSWNIEQVLNIGNLTIDNNGTNNAIRIFNGQFSEMTPATNVRVVMLDQTATFVTVDFDSPHDGLLVLQLRNGNREVNFTGDNNSIGGLLRIEADNGVQNIFLARNADLNVGASLVINTRFNTDAVDESGNDINVNGALIFRNVNVFDNGHTLNVGGDFTWANTTELARTFFYNSGNINVVGNLTYLGGNGNDDIQFLAGVTNIGGYSFYALGESNDPVLAQRLTLQGFYNTENLWITGGTTIEGNFVVIGSQTTVNNQVIVNFSASSGPNSALFFGTYGGNGGAYHGGIGPDTVGFGANAANMHFTATLGNGNDIFVMEPTAVLAAAFLDFGAAGNDLLIDNLGMPWAFPAIIANL